jgi:hypothetical protein
VQQQVCTVKEQWKCGPSLHCPDIRSVFDYWTGRQNLLLLHIGSEHFETAGKMKKQLYYASWHYTMWHLPHSAEVVGEDPNSNHPPLAVPETQDWAWMPLSCVCSKNSKECDSRPHSHTKTATRGASWNGRTVGAIMYMLRPVWWWLG